MSAAIESHDAMRANKMKPKKSDFFDMDGDPETYRELLRRGYSIKSLGSVISLIAPPRSKTITPRYCSILPLPFVNEASAEYWA